MAKDSKLFLKQDFHLKTEIEEYPISIDNNSPLTSNVSFLNGVYYNTSDATLLSSLSSVNTVNTVSNSSSFISYTGLYNHALSFLYQDNYIIKSKICDRDNTDTSFLREISVPIKKFNCDRIKKGTFGISLRKNFDQYSRFLTLNNNHKYDNGQNASFIYLNDEPWLRSLTGTATAFTMCINFRLNNNWLNEMTTSSLTQYLIYKPSIRPRSEDGGLPNSNLAWTICSTAILNSLTYEDAYLAKFDPSAASWWSNKGETQYALRLTYFSPTANHALSGRFVFETFLDETTPGYIFPAINSSVSSNSMTSSVSAGGLTSNKSLLDGNWHQVIWTRDGFELPSVERGGAMYLDGIRLGKHTQPGSPGAMTDPNLFFATYEMLDKTIQTSTPIMLGARISPIDNQVVTPHFRIIEQNSTTILTSNNLKRKLIEPEYNIGISPLTAYDRGLFIENGFTTAQSLYTSGSNTNIFSYFGATNIEKFLAIYKNENTSDIIPNNNFSISDSDEKSLNTSYISSQYGTHGFNGNIASFYFWDDSLENLDIEWFELLEPKMAEFVNSTINPLYSNNYIYKQYINQREPVTDYSLVGCYQFFKENLEAFTVKNRILSNTKKYTNIESELYGYYGAGVFINHNNFKKNTQTAVCPNASIKYMRDFYDIPEPIFTTNLNHGKIVYIDSSKNIKDSGIIFYDLGLVIFDSNIFLTNSITSSLLSSISSNSSMLFTVSNTSSNNFYIDEINYSMEKMRFSTYIDVNIDGDEFNQTTNKTSLKNQDFSYPTTISFYNDRDECLYVSKINNLIEKNKFLQLKYKAKISF